MAPGLPLLPDDAGYRLYLESLFDELSTEVKVLFDRRDPASVLWPRRLGVRVTPRDAEQPRARRDLGRRRDDRLGLPVLQRRRRAQEDARREPGATEQPGAGRPQPVLHAALRRPVPDGQHPRPHVGGDARRGNAAPRVLRVPRPADRRAVRDAAPEGSARPADPRSRLRVRATSSCTAFDLLLVDLRGGVGGRRPEPRQRRSPGGRLRDDYPDARRSFARPPRR